ncbi:carboxylesterase 12 [Pyrus ussuriensis x Pyrus communis]|uniref:Carboxylesterase 12 n=1 Tax=Pyrus ussuriensis x Pyrus communis TaxID=2448454 RepID=A0A5N5HP83_9ROSA|nr:carboxylesterase 12 [Pyrus ussuriensis x Pyrus communis]
MDSKPSSSEVSFEFPTLFRIYKDGRTERLMGTETVPPSTDPTTGVQSKDIVLSPQSGLSARIFLPKLPDPTRKLPLLIFIHGGAFVIESPYSPLYHNHVSLLASEANVVALSVHYRRAPEHPLPVAFEDSWDAVQWAAAHSNRNGPEAWLNDRVDFDRVFIGGDSAGATLTHHVVRQAGLYGLSGTRIVGMILFHPFFVNDKPGKLLEVIYPTCEGSDDARVWPGKDPKLGEIGCGRVLVFVAEKDFLRDRGRAYYEALKKSGYGGVVEIVESEGEGHVFHLFNPSCDKAVDLVRKVVFFINQD